MPSLGLGLNLLSTSIRHAIRAAAALMRQTEAGESRVTESGDPRETEND